MVTATHLGGSAEQTDSLATITAAGGVPQLPLLALANSTVTQATRGRQSSPAWLETAGWQPLK